MFELLCRVARWLDSSGATLRKLLENDTHTRRYIVRNLPLFIELMNANRKRSDS